MLKANSKNIIKLINNKRLLLLIILLATIVSYSNIIHGEFQLDDITFINEGLLVTKPASFLKMNIIKMLTSGVRPITQLTFALNYTLGATNVEDYHLFNICIHLLMVVLVFLFVKKTLCMTPVEDAFADRSAWMALAVAGLFALHPLQTASVSYIVQRAEIIASLFYLLSLFALIKFSNSGGKVSIGFWLLGMLCFLIGWGSKQIIVTVPAAFLLYGLFFLERRGFRKAAMGLLPLFIIGVALGLRIVTGFKGSTDVGFDIAGLSQTEYFFTQMRVLVTYLRLIVLPVNQNVDYDYPIFRDVSDPNVLASALFWLLIIAFCFHSLRVQGKWKQHFKVMGFGMLWFLIVLLPTSSVIPIKDVIFEHRLYLPILGVILTFVAAADLAFLIAREKLESGACKVFLILLSILVMTSFAAATYTRNMVWRTKLSLWQDAVRKSPQKTRPHNNLGDSYMDKGLYQEAINEFRHALSIEPNHASSLNNLGLAYLKINKLKEAEKYLTLAALIRDNYADPHINLGLIYFQRGAYLAAAEKFKKALKIQPNNPGIFNNLGGVYAMLKQYQKSIYYFQEALRINPAYVDAQNNLKRLMQDMKMKEKS